MQPVESNRRGKLAWLLRSGALTDVSPMKMPHEIEIRKDVKTKTAPITLSKTGGVFPIVLN